MLTNNSPVVVYSSFVYLFVYLFVLPNSFHMIYVQHFEIGILLGSICHSKVLVTHVILEIEIFRHNGEQQIFLKIERKYLEYRLL